MSAIWSYVTHYGKAIKCATCEKKIVQGSVRATVGNSSDGPMEYICSVCVDRDYNTETARKR